MLVLAVVTLSADPDGPAEEVAAQIMGCYDVVQQLRRAEQQSEYQLEKLLAALEE
jgi:hypothetical protein